MFVWASGLEWQSSVKCRLTLVYTNNTEIQRVLTFGVCAFTCDSLDASRDVLCEADLSYHSISLVGGVGNYCIPRVTEGPKTLLFKY